MIIAPIPQLENIKFNFTNRLDEPVFQVDRFPGRTEISMTARVRTPSLNWESYAQPNYFNMNNMIRMDTLLGRSLMRLYNGRPINLQDVTGWIQLSDNIFLHGNDRRYRVETGAVKLVNAMANAVISHGVNIDVYDIYNALRNAGIKLCSHVISNWDWDEDYQREMDEVTEAYGLEVEHCRYLPYL
jgi:hypothetical protein